MSQEIKISIIIPTYNEEKRLPGTLMKVNDYLKKQDYSSEIIVADGGSLDRTIQFAKNLANDIPNLKILELKGSGKGFAVQQGMLKARGQYRIFTDADNSTSIEQLEKMWPEFEAGYQVVIGSRVIKGSILAVPQPFYRRLLGDLFRLLRKLIIGLWEIKDTQCGFKGFTAQAAEKVFPKITIFRFGFDPEVLIIAKKMGYNIKEIPITWVNDLESKVRFKSMAEMLFELIKIRLNLILGRYN